MFFKIWRILNINYNLLYWQKLIPDLQNNETRYFFFFSSSKTFFIEGEFYPILKDTTSNIIFSKRVLQRFHPRLPRRRSEIVIRRQVYRLVYIWNCPLVLYLATRQQVIPTTVHGPFKLLTRPITRVPTCPLTAASYVPPIRAHTCKCTLIYRHLYTWRPLSELSGPCFLGSVPRTANLRRTMEKVSPICRLSGAQLLEHRCRLRDF